MAIRKLTVNDIRKGQKDSLEVRIDADMVDRFAALSGDVSSLHMNDGFARDRGFDGRVVHGVLISAFVSQLLGVRFPGESCLLQSLNMKYLEPVYVNDHIRVVVECDQISAAVNSMTVSVQVENSRTGSVKARGKAQVGFLPEKRT